MGMSRHQYLIKTDRLYREQVVTETILKMAQVIEVLASREGITWDADGNIQGLTDEETEALNAKVPAVDVDQVKEARPVHSHIQQEVAPVDAYANVPDPNAQFKSEKVDPNDPNQGSYLVDKIGDVSDPNAGVEEISDEQAEKFAAGGHFPEGEDASDQPTSPPGQGTGNPEDGPATDGSEESDDDGDGAGAGSDDSESSSPSESVSDEDDDGDAGDDGLTPKQRLKARAEELGLDSSGTKADLEARIAEAEKGK